jgi:hypothetical protein
MRIAAVMGGPGLPALPSYRALQHDEGDRMNPFQGTAAESDGDYFLRRFEAEMRAADEATVPQARKAHQELAERYAQLVAATRLSAERGRIATAGLFSQRKPIGIWTRTPRLRAALRDDVRQLASV